ncbi:MAG: hypothetical protein HY531_01370 [Chloroflexi bacterium]|nr:hypothetical protein [Chloroflexota bacterium]
MTYSLWQWRQRVEERLAALRERLAQLEDGSSEQESLLRRISMLEREVHQLEEDDQQWGTQWLDEESGAAADLTIGP